MKRCFLGFLIACMLAALLFGMQGARAAQPAPQGCVTVLLLGLDRTGEETRAPAIVLVSMNPGTGDVKMASIRRDILVEGSGGDIQLDRIQALGGPEAVLMQVNQLFQLDVAYYVSVDMAGMEKIIDTLGGIELDIRENELPVLMQDKKTKVFQKAGMQMLNGAQALAYMMDHTGEGEDGPHISKALSACMKKALHNGFDPLIDMVSDLLPYVETNMTLMDMMDVALSAVSVSIKELQYKQFPAQGKNETNGKETAVRLLDGAAEAEAIYAFLYTEPENP